MINYNKKFNGLLSFVLGASIIFSGQSIVAAADQYTEDLVPKMTSLNQPNGRIMTSTDFSDKHTGVNAFNDEIDGYAWATSGTAKGWLQYEFTEPKKIEKYTLRAREYLKGESPKDWTFEAHNGTNWVVLDTQSGITGWTPGEIREFTFNNKVAYSKYRINITANNGLTGIYIFTTIEEMEMMEKISTEPANPVYTASNTWFDSSNHDASKAFDGDLKTRWATNDKVTEAWIEVDFGKETTFNTANISEYENRITSFKIQYWNGTEWQDAHSGTNIGKDFSTEFPEVTATKARLLITSSEDTVNSYKGGPSINEFSLTKK